jgi:hypothetical protein
MEEWLGSVLDRFGISVWAYTVALFTLQIALALYLGWRFSINAKKEKDAKAAKAAEAAEAAKDAKDAKDAKAAEGSKRKK